nr:hypothetical protein TorRG33x02_095840 [Ipomoea trifida]
MASHNASATATITSPKSADGDAPANSRKGNHCLCSPTTHQGSFRCRLHRAGPTPSEWFKRSNSMPAKPPHGLGSLSPKSVEST